MSGAFWGDSADVPSVPPKPGKWRNAGGLSTVTVAMTANRLYAVPLRLERQQPLTGLGVYAGTAVAGTMKVGWYDDDGTFNPGAFIAENTGDLSTNVTGGIGGTFAVNPVRGPGIVWAAFCFSAAALIYATRGDMPACAEYLRIYGADTLAGAMAGWFELYRTAGLTYVAGSPFFPATFGPITQGGSAGPAFAYRS